MRTNYCYSGLLMYHLVTLSQCAVKLWLPDTALKKTQNWVDEAKQKNCRGLVFPRKQIGVAVLNHLTIKEMVLPDWGMILIGDNIKFEDATEDPMNCVQLKEFELLHWMDMNNWATLGESNNNAIPHVERVPCQYDDVVFPAGLQSSPCLLSDSITLSSLHFGGDISWNYADQLEHPELIDYILITRDASDITTTNKSCLDPTGCQCNSDVVNTKVCQFAPVDVSLDCLDPIKPIGYCTGMCGASLLLEPNMNIEDIRNIMKSFQSDNYISKVKKGDTEYIQIILAEKSFDGTSLDEGKELHDLLSKKLHSELHLSGPYYKKGETLRNALSLIFGTMCGVILVFVLIFLVNWQRFTKSYTRDLFARYDNSERVGLFCEGQSLNGSCMNLPRTLDSHMYGATLASTPSTSTDTIHLKEGDFEAPA